MGGVARKAGNRTRGARLGAAGSGRQGWAAGRAAGRPIGSRSRCDAPSSDRRAAEGGQAAIRGRRSASGSHVPNSASPPTSVPGSDTDRPARAAAARRALYQHFKAAHACPALPPRLPRGHRTLVGLGSSTVMFRLDAPSAMRRRLPGRAGGVLLMARGCPKAGLVAQSNSREAGRPAGLVGSRRHASALTMRRDGGRTTMRERAGRFLTILHMCNGVWFAHTALRAGQD